jgi:glycopeptide antibiotics resistance protein
MLTLRGCDASSAAVDFNWMVFLAMHRTLAPSPYTRRFGFALVVLSLAAIAWLTLRPAHASPSPIDSHLCVVCGPLAGVDILLNTLLFVPLGVGLKLSGLSPWKAVLICFALSLSIETAQAFIVRGRASTLSDILTNASGGAIGFWSARTAPMWLAPSRKGAAWLAAMWGAIWLLIQIVSSYSFSPSLSPSQYYGQIAQPGGRAMFHGQVDSARIGTIPIANGAFADSRSIRQLLLDGAPIVGFVRLAEPTPNFASIIRVADDKQRGIASIAEQGDQLVFSFRTGASSLRLREPAFGMPGVFAGARPPADSAAEALVISAEFNDGTVQLVAQTRSAHRELNFSPRAALAWTVVLPFHGHLESGVMERVATFLWTSVLLIPLGYWAATLARQLERVAAFSLMVALGALLAAGLILVPAAFALRGATPLDWIAAVSGLGIGASLTLLFNGRGEHASHQPASRAALI